MNFTAQGIFGIRAGGRGAIVAFTALDFHGTFSLAIIDRPAFGGCCKARIDKVFRNFNDLSGNQSAGLLEHFTGPGVMDAKSHSGHDIEGRPFDVFDLVVTEHPEENRSFFN